MLTIIVLLMFFALVASIVACYCYMQEYDRKEAERNKRGNLIPRG